MNNLFLIGWITVIIYILHETDAVPKWAKLLRLKFLKFDEYDKRQGIFSDLKYRHFLCAKYPNFFVELMTCQECLCVWLNILGYAFFAQFLGGWETFGVTIVISWMAIGAFKKLLGKIYE